MSRSLPSLGNILPVMCLCGSFPKALPQSTLSYGMHPQGHLLYFMKIYNLPNRQFLISSSRAKISNSIWKTAILDSVLSLQCYSDKAATSLLHLRWIMVVPNVTQMLARFCKFLKTTTNCIMCEQHVLSTILVS
jgi:hypothetical protein